MSADVPVSDTRWFILYRGPLSSCNYACGYCPFAKTRNTRAELEHDAACLRRFTDWVASRKERIGVLFTPWGEALIHRYYQEAMQRLSHLPNVWRVAAQTNLSFDPARLHGCNRETTALWTTYHPTETTVPRFVEKCRALKQAGIRHSVGVVGRKEAMEDISTLRAELPADTYVWVNAWKREADYYTTKEVEQMRAVDPHFEFNLRPHPSLGRGCRSGHAAFTVDGAGDARRCHFIKDVMANIYDGAALEHALRPRPCSIAECRCHIGYVHLDHLRLDTVFGDGLLERIPRVWPGLQNGAVVIESTSQS
ncbi:MAG TPA: STM4011 family radical SAM protein [Prosthecobacter sp.]